MRTLQILVALCSQLVITSATHPDPQQKDDPQLQGKWVAVSANFLGKAIEMPPGAMLIVAGNKITWQNPGETQEMTFMVDATKNPKHIDLVGKNRDEKFLGIYEIVGDTLKMTNEDKNPFAKAGKAQRPTSFDSVNGPTVMIYKRAK